MPNNHLDFGVDLLPVTDELYNLGSSDKKWNLYANQISGLDKFNAIITGSGTTAVTSGTKMPALWRFNLGIASPSEGDVVTIKIPVAGHSNGVFVSLDNGTTYYPVSVSGTSLLTTHYGANQIISLVCVGSGGTNAIYPAQTTINGNSYTLGTSANITGKHWCVLNYYDSGNINTLQRTFKSTADVELPIAGINASNSTNATYDQDNSIANNSYAGMYAAIPNDKTKLITINPSTGHLTVPGGITGDLTGNASTATTATTVKQYYTSNSTNAPLQVRSNNKNVYIWLAGHATSADDSMSNHYALEYHGEGSSPNNYLILKANNNSTTTNAVQVDENGNITVAKTISGTITNATSATSASYLTAIQLTDQDLNDYKNQYPTWYYAAGSNTVTNVPDGVNAFGMYVYRNADGYRVQELYSSGGAKWMRYWNSSTWSAWERILTSANYSSYALPLSGGTMKGTITFEKVTSTSYPANSYGLSWSGDNDGASIYYSQRAANSGHLVLQTTDDSNETIIFRHTKKADSNNYDGVIISPYYAQIYPAVNTQGSIGTSDYRWNNGYYNSHLYVGPTTYTAYNSDETGTYIEPGGIGLSNTTAQRGYYLRGGSTQYARMYINAIGKASTADAQGALGGAMLELGNNIARGASGTTDGAHNARGYLRLYSSGSVYTQIVSNLGGTTNYNFWLPNYAGEAYAVHVGSASAVGNSNTPVYIAANGRATIVTKYLATHTAGSQREFEVKYDDTIDMAFMIGAGNENHGIYDYKKGTSGAWILSAGLDNNWSLNGNATTATTATWATLIKPINSATTASASTWSIPSGSYQVWGERFSDTRLKYTPEGGSETTVTDTGDWTMWLTSGGTTNTATLNMRIDGTYYGSFSGNLSGNATGVSQSTSTTASYRKILLSGGDVYTAWNTNAAARTGTLYQATSISVQPSTGTILANKYIAESTDDASSTSTGTLIVNGGVGIAKKLYVGGDTTISTASTATLTVQAAGTNTVTLALERAGSSAAGWRWQNASGTLRLQNNYTTSKGNYFNIVSYAYNTGNVTIEKGDLILKNDPSEAMHAATKQYVDNSFAANDAMVYKGVLNKDATETATSLKNVPASGYSAGWTYKVAVAGTYANVSCEVGDMVIAVTDAAANQSAVNNAHWTVVQSNLVGAVVATSGESGYIAKFSGANTITKGPKIGTSTTTWLNEKGEWSTPTAANVGASASNHTHGNITNDGGMTATGVALADGDTLLFVDSSETNKLIKQTSITFDGSTTTSALSKKGTWESTVTVSVAANDTSSTGTFPVMYAATNTSTTTAKNDTLKKSTGKLYFQPSTGTLTATKFSGDLSGTATNATNIRVSLNTNTKLYLLGTTSAPIDALIGVNLPACEDTGVYVTSTAGALSAVQHSYNVSGTEKAYTTYNTTDDSIDFIFI